MKTQTGGAVVPNPEAINKRQDEKTASAKWSLARARAIWLLVTKQITEEEEKVLSDMAYKEYNDATSEPILKLTDLLKPRPIKIEETL